MPIDGAAVGVLGPTSPLNMPPHSCLRMGFWLVQGRLHPVVQHPQEGTAATEPAAPHGALRGEDPGAIDELIAVVPLIGTTAPVTQLQIQDAMALLRSPALHPPATQGKSPAPQDGGQAQSRQVAPPCSRTEQEQGHHQ